MAIRTLYSVKCIALTRDIVDTRDYRLRTGYMEWYENIGHTSHCNIQSYEIHRK